MPGTPPLAPQKRRGRRAHTPTTTERPSGPCRVCIYIRRSTDDEHQPFSLHAQRAALEKYVASQPGWTIVAEYEDDASGATTERPGLQKALHAAKAGLYDVLLVYRLDRFSRSVADLLDLITILEASNVRFSSATEPVDTGGPFGRMMLQLLAVFAEFERNIIIDRVKSGMTAKASKGKWTGGTRPYGYRVDPDTHRLVPHPDEAPILREIFRLYTRDRYGTRAIATELNARSIPNRTGKTWSGHTINRILDNPAYVGDIAYRDVYVPNAHEPLIDRATLQRAQDIANARGDAQTQRAMSDSDYYLTGLLTCPHCGQRYIGTSAKGRTRRYRYYTCFTRTRYGKHATCPAPRLPADDLDQMVLQALYDFYTTAEPVLTAMIERAQAQRDTTSDDRRAELTATAYQITSTETAISRYHTAFENGTMDDATAGPRIRELRQRLAQLHTRHAELETDLAAQPAPPPPGTITRIRDHLSMIMTSGTTAERKAAIETLIAEVRLTDQGVVPVFKIPTDTTMPPPDPDGGTHDDQPPVRTMVRSVGRTGLEPVTDRL
ncbi:recombinase family protein [Micromonospora eburnea]|uniref:Site-specific DNA recombinase n=1 Tax=Micromonospora eburnea TaxID=227316 RepID=A0A1C6VAC7_9ACTN|nr:recombinase family protein [Micromonospora eburnea]SCL63268.1 site-specific DNA recombinase [Micromonospora eburnea]